MPLLLAAAAVSLALLLAGPAGAQWRPTVEQLGDAGDTDLAGLAILPQDGGIAAGSTVAMLRDGRTAAVAVPGEEDSLGSTSTILPRADAVAAAAADDGTLAVLALRPRLRLTVRQPPGRFGPAIGLPGDGGGVVAAGPGGRAAVAFERAGEAWLAVREPGADAASVRQLGTDGPAAVAVAPDGRVLVAVLERDGGTVALHELSSSGTLRREVLGRWRPSVREPSSIAVAAGADGAATVVWTATVAAPPAPLPVLARRRASGAPAFSAPQRLGTVRPPSRGGQAVAATPDGGALAVFVAGTPRRVLAVRAGRAGVLGAPVAVSRRRGPRDASSPALDVNARGDALASWSSGCAACDTKAMAAAAPAGGRFRPERTLSGLGTRARATRAAVGPEGSAAVGWSPGSVEAEVAEAPSLPVSARAGDVRPPRLRLTRRSRSRVRVTCGEQCLAIPFDRRVLPAFAREGTTTLFVGRPGTYRVRAVDGAGNVATRSIRVR